jgi:hypothetical protein
MESRKMVKAVSKEGGKKEERRRKEGGKKEERRRKEGGKKAEAYLSQFGGVKLQFPILEQRLLFPVNSTRCRRPPACNCSFYAATFSNSVDRT